MVRGFISLILLKLSFSSSDSSEEARVIRNVLIIIVDLWKGFTVIVLGVALLASSFLIPFHSFLPAWTYRDGSYTIKAREQSTLSIGLFSGSIVRGMLVITGGDGSISFRVEDSGAKVVTPQERARDRYFFEFQPIKTDSYVFILDNSDDSAEQSVYWIVWVYYYNFLFLFSGIILLVAGAIAMLIEERRLSRKVAQTLEEACEIVSKARSLV